MKILPDGRCNAVTAGSLEVSIGTRGDNPLTRLETYFQPRFAPRLDGDPSFGVRSDRAESLREAGSRCDEVAEFYIRFVDNDQLILWRTAHEDETRDRNPEVLHHGLARRKRSTSYTKDAR